jgi:cystathionine beta-lyase/cystathionine gamma-synthase
MKSEYRDWEENDWLGELQARLDQIRRDLGGDCADDPVVVEELREFLRRALIRVAGTVTSRRWQAPAISHSTEDQCFRGYNQAASSKAPFPFLYSRWYSSLVHEREQEFLSNYGLPDCQICLLTGAGMAAINLALEAVLRQHPVSRFRLLTFGHVYGETRDQCQALAATQRQVVYQPVESLGVLQEVLASESAADGELVWILCGDAVENSPAMRVFSLQSITATTRRAGGTRYLILDRTLIGHLWRSRIQKAIAQMDWNLIEVESLTKYHQLGLDITTGGAVYFPQDFAEQYVDCAFSDGGLSGLWRLRASLGLTPTETALCALAPPGDARQERRMRRHFRNAALLAQAAFQSGGGLWRVEHPSLAGHPDYGLLTRDGTGAGLIFVNSGHPRADAGQLARELLQAAHEAKLVLTRRASFGFNETSIDVWEPRTLRISAGAETYSAAVRLAELMGQVLERNVRLLNPP